VPVNDCCSFGFRAVEALFTLYQTALIATVFSELLKTDWSKRFIDDQFMLLRFAIFS
jgi:hypothetical protein